jgi:hypothetical protein
MPLRDRPRIGLVPGFLLGQFHQRTGPTGLRNDFSWARIPGPKGPGWEMVRPLGPQEIAAVTYEAWRIRSVGFSNVTTVLGGTLS